MKHPFRDKTKEEMDLLVGQVIEKVSRKPFSSGERTDIIKEIVTNPHTGRAGFILRISGSYIEAQQCRLIGGE